MSGIVRPVSGSADRLADRRAVALVVRIHRHRDVAQHRFRARRRHDHGATAICKRIANLPELALLLFALDLEVGHRRAERRVPVDEALAAIDEAVVVQAHERFEHRGRQTFVHREALARPVGGRAQAPHLLRDGGAGFFLPRPHALDELFATEIVPRRALAGELLLDDDLRRDARVIGADLPQRVVAAHAVIADHEIHQRLLERMAHVKRPVTFGGGSWMQNGGASGVIEGLEKAARLPRRVPRGLDGRRLKAFGEFHRCEV